MLYSRLYCISCIYYPSNLFLVTNKKGCSSQPLFLSINSKASEKASYSFSLFSLWWNHIYSIAFHIFIKVQLRGCLLAFFFIKLTVSIAMCNIIESYHYFWIFLHITWNFLIMHIFRKIVGILLSEYSTIYNVAYEHDNIPKIYLYHLSLLYMYLLSSYCVARCSSKSNNLKPTHTHHPLVF